MWTSETWENCVVLWKDVKGGVAPEMNHNTSTLKRIVTKRSLRVPAALPPKKNIQNLQYLLGFATSDKAWESRWFPCVQHSSAFLLLPSWYSTQFSLPPTPLMVFNTAQPSSYSSWCSTQFSLPPTPIMVISIGQPLSYSRMGQSSCQFSHSPTHPTTATLFLFSLGSHCDVYRHRCLRTCTCTLKVYSHWAKTNSEAIAFLYWVVGMTTVFFAFAFVFSLNVTTP